MLQPHHTHRCGIAALHPLQIAEIGGYPQFPAARFQNRNTQDIPAQPGGNTAGPTVTQTVPQSLVAEVTVGSMDIHFPRLREPVNGCRIFQPPNIEIFPESGSPQLQHAAPVFPQGIQGTGHIPSIRSGFENIVAHKGGQAFRTAGCQTFPIDFFRIQKLCPHSQGIGLLGIRHRNRPCKELSQIGIAFFRFRFLIQLQEQPPGTSGCQHMQGLDSRIHRPGIALGGPVHKPHFGGYILSVFTNVSGKQTAHFLQKR